MNETILLEQPREVPEQPPLKEKVLDYWKKTTERVRQKLDEDVDFRSLFPSQKIRLVIPLVCIVISIVIATTFRIYPLYLTGAEGLVAKEMERTYREHVIREVEKDYPTLLPEQQQAFMEQELQLFYREHPDQVQQQYQKGVTELKAYFQDEKNITYLLANDPYLWYKETKNYLAYGHLGDTFVEREKWYSFKDGLLGKTRSVNSLRNGREGVIVNVQLHPILGAYWHKFVQLFNKDIPLEKTFFLLPVVITALSIIPLFFLTRKISGNIGGLVAGIILATNLPLLDRTIGGFSDTDPYSVFFPLLISWIFIELWEVSSQKKRVMLAVLIGILSGIYSMAWSGWWYTLGLILATIFFLLVYQTIRYFVIAKRFTIDWKEWKKQGIIVGIILLTTGIASTIFKKNLYIFPKLFAGPFQFLQLKETAVSLWPQVFGTVSELHSAELSQIIPEMGGELLFFLALAGLCFTVLIKNQRGERQVIYPIFFLLWLAVTTYAFTKGARFSMLMVPAFAVLVGVCVQVLYFEASERTKKYLSISPLIVKAILLIFLITSLALPISHADQQARKHFPSMNDAWYASLMAIQKDSPDSIVTSWWDFGYFFTAIAERRVTFDGGDQGERVYWVGRLLLTDNEKEAFGILRMLNCGQEQAPHVLEKYLNKDTVKAVKLTHQIIQLTREQAKQHLQEAGLQPEASEEVLQVTHCENLLPNYVVLSPDMVEKAFSWTYFGNWDFAKALAYQIVKKSSKERALFDLTQQFHLTASEAENLYQKMQTEREHGITKRFKYYSSTERCIQEGEKLRCPFIDGDFKATITIDLPTKETRLSISNNPEVPPWSLVYATPKNVEIKNFSGEAASISVILVSDGKEYHAVLAEPPLAASMFTKLYFFGGLGQECFQQLSREKDITLAGDIITWKVDWKCAEKTLSASQQEE